MISRYRKTVLLLHNSLHEAIQSPYENIEKWLNIQEKLIKKIIYVEGRIRKIKDKSKDLNDFRKDPKNRLNKEDSIKAKSWLKFYDDEIDDYRWLLSIFRSIGDGIAFTFLSKWDIKPQNFKQSPGFISKKKGLTLELKLLRESFKRGHIAILNDITSVLKYSDITVLTDDGFLPIEVKSSKMYNERVTRQRENLNKLCDYLINDTTTDLYSNDGTKMIRVDLLTPEISHVSKFNELLIKSKTCNNPYTCFEEGFVCLIANDDSEDNLFERVISETGLREPYPFHLNMFKFSGQGYTPFSLLFNKSEDYWNFLEGNFSVFIFIDGSTIEKIARRNNYLVSPGPGIDWAFRFEYDKEGESVEIKEFCMSKHFFSRTYMEMTSLDWLIQDALSRFIEKNEILKGKELASNIEQ